MATGAEEPEYSPAETRKVDRMQLGVLSPEEVVRFPSAMQWMSCVWMIFCDQVSAISYKISTSKQPTPLMVVGLGQFGRDFGGVVLDECEAKLRFDPMIYDRIEPTSAAGSVNFALRGV